jgi:hypothetical protein
MWVVILKRRDYLENIAINGELKCILKEEDWTCGLHSFGSE